MLSIAQNRPMALSNRPQAARTAFQCAPQQSAAAPSVQFGFGVPDYKGAGKVIVGFCAVALFGVGSLAFMAGRGSSPAPTKPQAVPTVQQAEDPEIAKLKKELEIETLKHQLHDAQNANKPQ